MKENKMKQLKQYVQKFGGKVVNSSSDKCMAYQIEAPSGKVWNCDILHKLRMEWELGDKDEQEESIADAIRRVKHGLCDCDDSECEFCI